MRNYITESVFMSSGKRCVIIKMNEPYLYHRCGYVGIKKDNILHGLNYSTKSVKLIDYWNSIKETEPIGDRGIIPLFCQDPEEPPSADVIFNVHGGITYSAGSESGYPLKEDKELWWFGFDCAHAGDDKDGGQSLAYVKNQCRKLAEQLSSPFFQKSEEKK